MKIQANSSTNRLPSSKNFNVTTYFLETNYWQHWPRHWGKVLHKISSQNWPFSSPLCMEEAIQICLWASCTFRSSKLPRSSSQFSYSCTVQWKPWKFLISIKLILSFILIEQSLKCCQKYERNRCIEFRRKQIQTNTLTKLIYQIGEIKSIIYFKQTYLNRPS